MKVQDFNFDLPEEYIAQHPLKDRASSRLMILDKDTGEIKHDVFSSIKSMLKKGDCLVLNNTKVLPARLFGSRVPTGGKVEFLLLNCIEKDEWEVMVKPGRKAKVGDIIEFGEGILTAEVLEIMDGGNRKVKFCYKGIFQEVLDTLGEMPLPPYIKETLEDQSRYQTVYAKHEGSSAAPTAGLHFTPQLIEEIKSMGIEVAFITLHVGLGTFRPVKVEEISEHQMHSEYYFITKEEADKINKVKETGGRVIAVGTTSCRTLESVSDNFGRIKEARGWTDIFIYPGYRFKMVDALITNFHLPESTLIMLVSALAGRENVMNAYEEAVREKYRFFSFGDAMFIS